MAYRVLLIDEEGGRFETLAQTADPKIVAALRAAVPDLVPKPTKLGEAPKFFIDLPERRGPKGRKVVVTAVSEDSSCPHLKPGDAQENASELSTALGYVYNACSIALAQRAKLVAAGKAEDKAATLKGVSFMYEEDYHEQLLQGVRD